MKTRFLTLVLFLVAVLLAPVGNVEACGPFFSDDVFVSTATPDDFAAFGAGHLGILQSGFDSNEYAVAWRYLSGGKLSPAELHSYLHFASIRFYDYDSMSLSTAQTAELEAIQKQEQSDDQQGTNWYAVRAKYTPASTTPTPTTPAQQFASTPASANDMAVGGAYLNCPDGTFSKATQTLTARAAAWGAQSPYLAEWIRGQDAVFSNCAGANASMPLPVPAGSPELLKADRAYQIASALFYAHRFDEASAQFTAIAADKTSPWAPWGHYLAARATIRLAFGMGKATDPWSDKMADYDGATMKRAQKMLDDLIAKPHPTPSRSIVQNELNFVLSRTDPDRRAGILSAALAGPKPDPNFPSDIDDLNWLLTKQSGILPKSPAPLLTWIAAWREMHKASDTFALWQQTQGLPWLVITMAKAAPTDPFVPQLLDEAEKIAPDSPAYDTVFFHRVRLLIALKRTDEARALLDAALPTISKQKTPSKFNALLGERMATARDMNEFLKYAPRFTVSTGSQSAGDLQELCNHQAHPTTGNAPCPAIDASPWFDTDAVTVFNLRTPVSLMIEAANNTILPQNLRQSLAVVAWTRSILLSDSKSAAAIAPLLPKSMRDIAGSSTSLPAYLAILQNDGVRPYLEAGIPRVASVSVFDDYRNNLWCKSWKSDFYREQPVTTAPLSTPVFFTPDQVAQGTAEYLKLQQLPDGSSAIGQLVIDYAKVHPDDPKVPQALALTVRATRYGCQTFDSASAPPKFQPISKAAFDLLHTQYPKSPWTAKTPYYF